MERPVLLVTGGGRGIGAAISKLAGARGFDVAVNYRQDAAAAAGVVDAVKASGARAVAIQADVSREADVERLFAEVDSRLGRLTHLVFNSAITPKLSRVESMSTEALKEVFDVNVIGAFMVTRAAIARISTRHGGRGGAIVLVSSITAVLGAPNAYVWYAASKGAINTMATGLSLELAEDGIRVNAVMPGLTDTGTTEPERIAQVVPMIPLKRIGQPDEVARSVLFLLSDEASYVTGANLKVSGGR
ncbi:MAG TPA: SDR family oxidoreductase [Ramlibacter sp.]|uniref:SDR family oxidoreductase n=1 Tax=Ramlibacter sp. TaxID=1917967 RepID=UPI002BBC6C98|nr:SDR family oxidoreductase [Ramlibacter sp.]HVZ45851.1 SDR family oxidoreductase [Ramlibacter sp.]